MRSIPNNTITSYRKTKPTRVYLMGLFAVDKTAEERCEKYPEYTIAAKKGGE